MVLIAALLGNLLKGKCQCDLGDWLKFYSQWLSPLNCKTLKTVPMESCSLKINNNNNNNNNSNVASGTVGVKRFFCVCARSGINLL